MLHNKPLIGTNVELSCDVSNKIMNAVSPDCTSDGDGIDSRVKVGLPFYRPIKQVVTVTFSGKFYKFICIFG